MKAAPTKQKLRGGYYTPMPMARFLARWALRSASSNVLEPSCGDGNIIVAAAEELKRRGASVEDLERQLRGVELEPEELAKAQHRLASLGVGADAGCIVGGDFGAYCDRQFEGSLGLDHPAESFDAVLGNPPFIRYQSYPEEQRELAFSLMRRAGLHPNRLTNSWVPFVVLATALLKEDGRLGMVVPAELFQVSYAAEIRKFLSDSFHRLSIVTFRRLVFDDIQQEVVLVLGDKGRSGEEGVRTFEIDSLCDLDRLDPDRGSALKPMDHSTEKWTQYFLEAEEILLLRSLSEHPSLMRLGSVLDVDVGVVTGENQFFVLKDSKVKELGLSGATLPIVTKSPQLSGLIMTPEDFSELGKKDAPVHLLNAPSVAAEELPINVRSYVENGERNDYHRGYKCRIRKRWYVVPSLWVPDAFVLRQVHAHPKIVVNAVGATSTDTVHRGRLLPGAPTAEQLAVGFINSMTFAFSEVLGRSYGGGVLTFEPSESEHLPIPRHGYENLDFKRIDTLLREGDVDSALDLNDEILLRGAMGLDDRTVRILRNVWLKLRDRRFARKRGARSSSADALLLLAEELDESGAGSPLAFA